MDDAKLLELVTIVGELSNLLARIHKHPLGSTFLHVHVNLCTDAMAAINDQLERRSLNG